MDSQPNLTLAKKSKLMLRLSIIIVLSYGLVEIAEDLYHDIFQPTKSITYEIIEIVILGCLLILSMNKFIINPMLKEMSLRRESEELLKQSELNNRIIMNALPDSILNVSADGTVIDFKPAQNHIISFDIGKNVCDSLHNATLIEFLRCMNLVLKDGKPLSTDLVFKKGPEVCYYVFNFLKTENEIMVFIRDITRRKIYEEKLEHISTHDVLTGLYNRTYYEAELGRLATSRKYPVSIVIIDLDGLKITNDTYGHEVGDKMICKAADILRKAFRAEDMVARTGGDEFTVLLPATGDEGLQAAIERIDKSLEESNCLDDGIKVKFSLGGEIAASKETLYDAIRIADVRMYQNKSARKTASAIKTKLVSE